ncbi:hypothetical protein Tco_0077792 [Tanacetum coccineum]
MSYPHPKRNFVPKAVLMKTGMRPVNAAKPKAAYNAVKRNRFNVVKASACWVWMPKNRVGNHMDAQIQGGKREAKKKKNQDKCNKSRKTKKMNCMRRIPTRNEGEGLEIPTDPQHTPTIIQPSTSQPQKKQPRRKQRKDTKVPQPSCSTIPITNEAANEEHVPMHSNDPLLSAVEIAKLKERVKKLERRNKSRTPGLKRLWKVGRSAQVVSSEDEGLGAQEDASKQGRKVADLDADVEPLNRYQAAKPKAFKLLLHNYNWLLLRTKARGVVVQEPSEFTKTTSPSQLSQLPQAKDKGKAKMIEPEKPLNKKDQNLIDEKITQKLQAQLNAKLEEEEKLAKQKEEDANIAQEQEELTVKEKSKLFVELMDKRKKHFARLRAEEQRRKLPTKAQKRNKICTYLKNMAGFTHSQLKNKSFNEVQKAFDKTIWKFKEVLINIKMLQNIDREDMETLWKLVKAKHRNTIGLTRPEEAYERVLWGDLKVMFEPDVESKVWRNLHGHEVTI